jgi:hypothetical protein
MESLAPSVRGLVARHQGRGAPRRSVEGRRPAPCGHRGGGRLLVPGYEVWRDEQGWHAIHISSRHTIDACSLTTLDLMSRSYRMIYALGLT